LINLRTKSEFFFKVHSKLLLLVAVRPHPPQKKKKERKKEKAPDQIAVTLHKTALHETTEINGSGRSVFQRSCHPDNKRSGFYLNAKAMYLGGEPVVELGEPVLDGVDRDDA
jgi:hypothetical protein